MQLQAIPILFILTSHVAAIPPPQPSVACVLGQLAPALPMSSYNTAKFARPLSLVDAVLGANASLPAVHLPSTPRHVELELNRFEKRQSTCSNPRVRIEWDTYTDRDKQLYIDGIKCLMRARPSGRFQGSQNRYEDIVVLHQQNTPRVHGNAIFLLWHRYLLWTFEDMLRRECGFNRPFPWWDEARWSGRFQQSSVFSSRWMGTLLARGNCVTNGQFANLACNIGPGTRNQRHCLSRNGDEEKTANTRQSLTDTCNARSTFADMAACTEGGAHAWGHNGIGAVMQDVYASPSDPVFWLHHTYIDRNFWRWQDGDRGRRTNTISGRDNNGRDLSLDTGISMNGIRADVRVRDVLNSQSSVLCYRYSY